MDLLQYAIENLTYDYEHNVAFLTKLFERQEEIESMEEAKAERLRRMFLRCMQISDFDSWMELDISELDCKKYILDDDWAGIIYAHEKEQWEKAFRMALGGDGRMALVLGNLLQENRLSPALSKNASKFYKISAKQGNDQGMYELGMCYRWGEGGEFAEGEKAMHWFREAAKLGNKKAQALVEEFGSEEGIRILGLSALHGAEGEYCYWYKSRMLVEGYFEKADAGDGECQYELGRQLTPGIAYGALRRNAKEAARYYEMAAENGIVDAMFNLSNLYREGNVGLEPDAVMSFHWMERCMQAGDIEAGFEVGKRLVQGEGTDLDEELGMRYIREAAGQGLGRAIQYLDRIEA